MIKTFRGLLADGGQDRIRLSTIKGKVGYKIIKLATIQKSPGTSGKDCEGLVQIFKTSQAAAAQTIDFTDSDLLAIAWYSGSPDAYQYPEDTIVIFDNEIFNQDIYISYYDVRGIGDPMNYYIELEVIPLDDKSAEYTTVKDLRTRGF